MGWGELYKKQQEWGWGGEGHIEVAGLGDGVGRAIQKQQEGFTLGSARPSMESSSPSWHWTGILIFSGCKQSNPCFLTANLVLMSHVTSLKPFCEQLQSAVFRLWGKELCRLLCKSAEREPKGLQVWE